MDTGPVPQQIAAILVLDKGAQFNFSRVEELLAERIQAVPWLRQRLVRLPPGCGRAIWVEDSGFDVGRLMRTVRCRHPGDAVVVAEPLPRNRPL